MSNATRLDFYELSMLDSFIAAGIENTGATFEVFARRLPEGYRYGVFAGIERLQGLLQRFRFSLADLDYILKEFPDRLSPDTFRYIEQIGTQPLNVKLTAFGEGEIFFPNSPVLTVEGTLGELVLLETLILSVLNHDSGIASKAARIVNAAQGRPVIEMGSRRTHEEAAVDAAHAAMVVGFASTSNVEAGKRYGLPVAGTAAHVFTLAFDSELEAFKQQIKSQGPETTLLIDTYDVRRGALNAVEAWQKSMEAVSGDDLSYPQLGAVRIDSGDLAENAKMVREILDWSGLTETKIVVTSDLDEYVITDLIAQGAPIDVFGVGTKLVSAPPMGFVYKMVEKQSRESVYVMLPVSKRSKDKVSLGGKKRVRRVLNGKGKFVAEYRFPVQDEQESPHPHIRCPQAPEGEGLQAAQERYKRAFAELPVSEQKFWGGNHNPFTTSQAVGLESEN